MDRIDPKVEARLLSPLTTESDYGFLELKGRAGPRDWFTALAGREHCRADYRVRRAHYPFHVIEVVTGGQGRAVLDGHAFELRPGTFFRTRPDMRVHLESDARSPLQKVFFCVGGRGAERMLAASGLPAGRRRVQPDFGTVRDLALVLIREARRSPSGATDTCRHLMEAVLSKLGSSSSDRGEAAERARLNFERCREHLDADEFGARSLREVSAEIGLEPASVCRLFRRFLGVSPYQYLLRRRMERAAAFLLSGHGLVKEAAAHVGMSDPFHFSRLFRAVHGVPPSELIRAGATGAGRG